MATQTLHYHLTKPASADRVAIGDINDNSDTIDGYLFQANERADQLADDYNTSSTYNTGDYVRRDNYIYKCNTDDTTGTWDDTKWDRVKITEELGNGGGGGSSTFAGLNDVNVAGVQNGDIARYNSTTRKWTKSSDLTDLELSVSQLSSSVLSIAGDVDALELTVSQMSASTLPYDANTSTKQKIDSVESSIPTSASDLPYSSTQSTKQKIDSDQYSVGDSVTGILQGAGFIDSAYPTAYGLIELDKPLSFDISNVGVSVTDNKIYCYTATGYVEVTVTSVTVQKVLSGYRLYMTYASGTFNSSQTGRPIYFALNGTVTFS